jgi:hypothetical protein
MLKELAKKKPVAQKALEALEARGKMGKKTGVAPGTGAAKKTSIAEAEKRFEALSAWLADELKKVRGQKKKESKLLEEATSRYADIRTDIGQDPSEAVVHFFAADGCGYGKHREPAFLRVKPTDAELKRWVEAIS